MGLAISLWTCSNFSFLLTRNIFFTDGISSGPFKRDTFFLAPSINSALDSSKAGYISTGLPAWNSVHVSDLAELYLLLLKNPGNETWGGYYFAETGEVSFKRIAESIAAAVEQLQGRKVDVGSWNVEEAKKATRGVGGQFIWGSNGEFLLASCFLGTFGVDFHDNQPKPHSAM